VRLALWERRHLAETTGGNDHPSAAGRRGLDGGGDCRTRRL